MKQRLLLTTVALALIATTNSAFAIKFINKCIDDTSFSCPYTNYKHLDSGGFNSMTDTQCIANAANDHVCWREDQGKCQPNEDNGFSPDSKTGSCSSLCEKHGYTVYVITIGTEWGCACEKTADGYWQDIGNGRERYYSYTYQTASPCNKIIGETATSQYRCKSGYYGNSSSGCTQCPPNATCNGGTGITTFVCDYRYYKNGTQCAACPDSAAGGLGTLVRTNTGATADTNADGATSITECYIDGLSSYFDDAFKDETGTFYLTDECFYTN